MLPLRRFIVPVLFVAVLAVIVGACGGDDSSDSDAEAVSRAQGTQGDVNLSLVVNEIEAGIGTLGRAERQAVRAVADGDSVCAEPAIDRAAPQPSQVEVEIIMVIDGCLRFEYDVANFRGLVDEINMFRDQPDVIAVSPLLLEYRLDQIESQWPIDAVGGSSMFARTDSPTGRDVTVALIDSGVDASHPMLERATIERAPDSGVGDYAATGHGTIAASVIVSPIGVSARAIAPAITVLDVPADLCDPAACGCDPCAPMTPAEAIRWSADNGADIISMSFGFVPAPKPAWWQLLLDADEIDSVVDTLEISLAYADAKGIAMTAAAGNCAEGQSTRCETEDQFELPAGHPAVIGVAAVDADDDGNPTRAWYSTRQRYVELAAPGNLVIANGDDDPITKNGTSYATPFVSAAVAVLIGSDGPLAAQQEAPEIARQLLTTSALDLMPEGRDIASGYGQLQLDAALAAAEDLVRQREAVDEP